MRNKDIRRECEELWAKNKYFVLSKSHKACLEIRDYLKGIELDVLWLNEKSELSDENIREIVKQHYDNLPYWIQVQLNFIK